MDRNLKPWAGALAGLVVAALPPIVQAAAPQLPAGLTTRRNVEGLVLATADGQPLYRLDFDRSRRRSDGGRLAEARCAGVCDRLWRPVPAPKGFTPAGDWGASERRTGAQLTFKGDPLYSFVGRSLDEAAKIQVAPPYFSSYAAKPVELHEGVPVTTLYWHPALYQPPKPKLVAPAGVTAYWAKAAYVFADAESRPLYAAASGRACSGDCGGLKPFSAPLAALPVGDWRPVEGPDGARRWAYRGRLVYQARDAQDDPGPDWRALEIR